MELGLPGKRNFLICQLYREWALLGQGPEHNGSTIPQQMVRWLVFLEQWERALVTGKEVIVLGDFNLDHMKFNKSGRLQPLVDKLLEQVFPHGVHQLVHGPTRSWPGAADSGLDHIWTNEPQKLSQAVTQFRGSSDHKLVSVTKFAKNIKQNTRYCKKRSYKNFCEQDFLAELQTIRWWDVYASTDPDEAVDIFTKKLTDILDRMAPVKKFQTRTKYAAWVSDETKDKIKQRDHAQQIASASG
jgi:hypothetical protein